MKNKQPSSSPQAFQSLKLIVRWFRSSPKWKRNPDYRPAEATKDAWVKWLFSHAPINSRTNPDLKKIIWDATQFLPEDAGARERLFYITNGETKQRVCVCGTPIRMGKWLGLAKACSVECANETRSEAIKASLADPELRRKAQIAKERAVFKKYGVKNVSQVERIQRKKAKTFQRRYGGPSPMSDPKVVAKQIRTNKKNHGGKHHTQTQDYLDKIRKVSQTRYGVDHYTQSESVKLAQVKTIRERYGVDHYAQSEESKDKQRRATYQRLKDRVVGQVKPLFDFDEFTTVDGRNRYKFQCLRCDTVFKDTIDNGHIPRCRTCYPPQSRSRGEGELAEWIETLLDGKRIVLNKRLPNDRRSVDILLPDHKIALEYNGLYWHSNRRQKNPKCHQNKTLAVAGLGYKLIHVFEDDWVDKQRVVKNILKSALGIGVSVGARKTEVRTISSELANKFVDRTHLQGQINAKVSLGLFYEGKLVSVLTFSKPRFDKQYDWEILRYCTKPGVRIQGGFSKMLKHFRSQHPGSIVTYADASWSDGRVYEASGFKRVGLTRPNLWYLKGYKKRLNRMGFQKHLLPEKLETYDPELTAWENMQANGYERIFDCGSWKFVLV